MDKRKIHNVMELLDATGSSEELKHVTREALDASQIVRRLMSFRAARGMSQADVARKMNCTQSRVSKLEATDDVNVRYGDLAAYAEAVDCELRSAVLPRDLKLVDRVKAHAFAIDRHLKDMVSLAESDEKISEGAAQFIVETAFNIFRFAAEAARNLPKKPNGDSYLEFSFEEMDRLEGPIAESSPSSKGDLTVKPKESPAV